MEFYIKIHKSEYGYDVCCPAFRGCHSQGDTEKEAIENIKIAIKEYMKALKELKKNEKLHRIKVSI